MYMYIWYGIRLHYLKSLSINFVNLIYYRFSQISLVTVTTPLEMTFIKRLISKNERDLGEAIINQINEIDRKGFKVEQIIWDSESSIRGEGLTNKIKGRVNNFEIFEPGRHVARVERKIQRIKKMFRAVKTSSVYEWDSNMDSACVNSSYMPSRFENFKVIYSPFDSTGKSFSSYGRFTIPY